MLAAWASCANEYAKEKEEEEKMTLSTKCHKALLKHKRDYLLNNILLNKIYQRLFYITRLFFPKLLLKVGFRQAFY